MIIHKEDIDLFPESPVLKGGIRELFEIRDHAGPFGVAVDIPYTGDVVFIGVDNA